MCTSFRIAVVHVHMYAVVIQIYKQTLRYYPINQWRFERIFKEQTLRIVKAKGQNPKVKKTVKGRKYESGTKIT